MLLWHILINFILIALFRGRPVLLFLQTRNPPILPPFTAIFKGKYSALEFFYYFSFVFLTPFFFKFFYNMESVS